MMNIESVKMPAATLVKVKGRMDAEAAPAFLKVCEALAKDGALQQVVDLQGLEYISSAGLSQVLLAARSVKAMGGTMVLCGLQGIVKQIFTVTKFDSLLPIYQTADEAFAKI